MPPTLILPGPVSDAMAAQRRREPRVLWVSAEYAPDVGGSQASFRAAIAALAERGYGSVVVSDDYHGHRLVGGVPVLAAPHDGDALEETLEVAARALEPSLLATQLTFALRALSFARRQRLRTAYFIRAPDDDLAKTGGLDPTVIIANSERTAAVGRASWKRDVAVLRPMIDADRIRAERPNPSCVTMVNTFPTKGADRFLAVARALPERRFLAARCWTMASRSAVAEYEVDFREVSNVDVVGPVEDVREIYARTRVLLVPSRWLEPFGRVVAEAHVNGIPVVGSPVLRDAWGDTIDYVEDADDPAAWATVLRALDDPPAYAAASNRGRRWAAAYRLDDETDRLVALFDQAMKKGCAP